MKVLSNQPTINECPAGCILDLDTSEGDSSRRKRKQSIIGQYIGSIGIEYTHERVEQEKTGSQFYIPSSIINTDLYILQRDTIC